MRDFLTFKRNAIVILHGMTDERFLEAFNLLRGLLYSKNHCVLKYDASAVQLFWKLGEFHVVGVRSVSTWTELLDTVKYANNWTVKQKPCIIINYPKKLFEFEKEHLLLKRNNKFNNIQIYYAYEDETAQKTT